MAIPPHRCRRTAAPACAAAWALCLACVLPAGPARAQAAGGLLPATGFGRGEDLRGNLEQFLPAPQPRGPTRAWDIRASIGVDLGVTDNAGGTGRGQTDFYTDISPTVDVTGDTARLKVRLSYSPQLYAYARDSSQTRVSQNLNASATAELIQQTLFLDVRGLISEQSRFGSNDAIANQYNTQFNSRQNTVENISFSATPYVIHRFAGWGTGRVGYTIARTLQDNASNVDGFNNGGFNNGAFNNGFNTLPGYGVTGNLTTHREFASFLTGENFGRFSDEVTAEAMQYSGGGSYRGAYRNTFNNEFGYALTRSITLLAGVGYQDLRFSGQPGYRLSEPTWNVGARLIPNPDSSITVTYGRRDGSNDLSLDGTYAPTARTRVIARYSTGVSSDLEGQQGLLRTTRVGTNGLLVDNVSGVPVSSGSGFGLQDGISRIRRLSVTALLILDRNSFAATVTNEERTALTSTTNFFGTTIPNGTNSTSTSGSLSWQHDLNPNTSFSLIGSYGVTDNSALFGSPGAGSQTTLSFSANLGHTFTETLTGSVRYYYSDRSGGAGSNVPAAFGGNTTQNSLVVGLRKSF